MGMTEVSPDISDSCLLKGSCDWVTSSSSIGSGSCVRETVGSWSDDTGRCIGSSCTWGKGDCADESLSFDEAGYVPEDHASYGCGGRA